jgi:drug/metabolite transporter (DMT)-like permease
MLQGVVVIYTISSLMSKKASASEGDLTKFLFWFGLEFVVLGVYAILWQQMIKRFELSIAYANRSMAVVWSMVWAVVFFHDTITVKNIVGVVLVVVGTIIVNGEGGESRQWLADIYWLCSFPSWLLLYHRCY